MATRRRNEADADLRDGTVVATHRRHYAVALDGGETMDCVLKGRRATIACGDRVAVRRVPGGGAIETVHPRRNLVYRSDAFKEKLIAANVTLIVGVVAPDLPVDLELVDRWSVAAEAEGCSFVIVANKADLADATRLVAASPDVAGVFPPAGPPRRGVRFRGVAECRG